MCTKNENISSGLVAHIAAPEGAFKAWWNSDTESADNPYSEESSIYWAWEGWCAALAAAPTPPVSEDRWLPIETAPKDGSHVLLAGKRREDIASGYWLQSAYAGNGAWIWPFVHKDPTHWMPLPKAPAMQEDKP